MTKAREYQKKVRGYGEKLGKYEEKLKKFSGKRYKPVAHGTKAKCKQCAKLQRAKGCSCRVVKNNSNHRHAYTVWGRKGK